MHWKDRVLDAVAEFLLIAVLVILAVLFLLSILVDGWPPQAAQPARQCVPLYDETGLECCK